MNLYRVKSLRECCEDKLKQLEKKRQDLVRWYFLEQYWLDKYASDEQKKQDLKLFKLKYKEILHDIDLYEDLKTKPDPVLR